MWVSGWYRGWYGKCHVFISLHYWFIYGVYMYVFISLIGPQKTITTWSTIIGIFTLHWFNSIIRNDKCIFTKLNADLCPVTVTYITVNSITNTRSIQQTHNYVSWLYHNSIQLYTGILKIDRDLWRCLRVLYTTVYNKDRLGQWASRGTLYNCL